MFPPQKGAPQSKLPPPKNKAEISRKDKPTDRGIPAGLADATQDDQQVHHATSIDRKAIGSLINEAENSIPDDDVNDDDIEALSNNDPEASTVAKDPEQRMAASKTRPQMKRVTRLPGPNLTTEHGAAALAARRAPNLKGGEGWSPR